MKCITSFAIALCFFIVIPASMETDAFTSASVTNHYADFALKGKELMDALNSFSDFYQVANTNPDGFLNMAFIIFGCKELGGKYYQYPDRPSRESVTSEPEVYQGRHCGLCQGLR